MTARWSLAGRIAAALGVTAALTAVIAALITSYTDSPVLGTSAALLIAAGPVIWLAKRIPRPWISVIRAVRDGVVSLRDHDLSVSVGYRSEDELGELVEAYNSLGDLLRRERLDLYQRELLLDTVIQTTPITMVLTNAKGSIVYSNLSARQLFLGGRKLEGLSFDSVIADAPAALREALASDQDTLFTMELGGESQVFHLSQRWFLLNAQRHRLVLLKQLTRELASQEVTIWKKVIRVIAHELNNSLAPISSLAHSGRLLAQNPTPQQLERVFTTIEDRAAHLASFIDGYARFAKLPRPQPTLVDWRQFFARFEGAGPYTLLTELPKEPARFDASQMEQVMINLLKNAHESGSKPEDVTVSVHTVPDGWVIEVADRGSGLSENVLRDALLPFYSTKPTGTGLGLTLCREIVEAHGGRLSLANRTGGGAAVTVWLPSGEP